MSRTLPADRLFPSDLPELEWAEFPADGFSGPVAGVIHRSARPAVCGVPLGGVDTGCLDLETDGTLGYSTVFNSLVPRGGPYNIPLLGLALGWQSWILSTAALRTDPLTTAGAGSPPIETMRPLSVARARPAREIDYWGHYPVADLEFDLGAPVGAGLRAWSPFVPGDVEVSSTPGAVFEVRLRNRTAEAQKGRLAISFPGPSAAEVGGTPVFERTAVHGTKDSEFTGVLVTHRSGTGYALGIAGPGPVRIGGDLGSDSGAWSRIASGPWFHPEAGLPPEAGQAGASVAVEFDLAPSSSRTIKFILAWHSPTWKAGGTPMSGGSTYTHRYAARFADAREVASLLAGRHGEILGRILAWQQVVYAEQQLPAWLRESLVNILHLITEDGVWAQARPPIGEWCRAEDGLFAMNECPRGCPQMECIPCSFYGNLPLVYFFPGLALSTLRAYKAYQFPDGQVPWIFGGCTAGTQSPPYELATPSRGYGQKPQTTLDGPCYVDMVDRLWRRTSDPALLAEFYPSVKASTRFTMNLRPGSGPTGIVSLPEGNNGQDWIESVTLYGIVPHIGGVHLANLRMAARMAEAAGDAAFADECRRMLEQGSEVLERDAWAGDCYLLYHEPETGKRSDVIAGFQLDGEWMARSHGLPGVFRTERVTKTLATLEAVISDRGAIVFTRLGDFYPGYWTSCGIHVPSSLMLAMVYAYHGERDRALEIGRRTMHAVVLENRCSWDSVLVLRGDTGERIYGNDYYQNLMLWALPAALAGKDLAAPCAPGGLVDRIIDAGRDAAPARKTP